MKKTLIMIIALIILAAAAVVIAPLNVYAKCDTSQSLDYESDIVWDCLFPLEIEGEEIVEGPEDNNTPSMASAPICVCPAPYPQYYTVGITLSYWEPARYAETVRDPYCFPSLGMDMGNSESSYGGQIYSNFGINASNASPAEYRANLSTMDSHWFVFPIMMLMNILEDLVNCEEGDSYGIEFLSEIDPLWHNDIYSFVIEPEGLEFANQAAQMSCMVDAASTLIGYSVDPLYWCVASGGSIFPLTGHVIENDALQAHNTAAARTQYRVLRDMEDCDTGINYCNCQTTLIWWKHDYRVQLAMPVRDYTCRPYGQTAFMWGYLKDPAIYSQRNFVWIIFRRHICCDAEDKEDDD